MAAEPPPPAAGGSETLTPAGLLLLACITLFWGLNWPVMKIALGELPVWSFRSFCLLGGGFGLLSIALLRGRSLRVPRPEIGPLLLCTVFTIIGWQLLSGYGLSMIPAGRAAIVAFTMPLWTTLLGSLVLGEALGVAKLSGLALGLAGLGVLIGPDLAALGTAPLGGAMMLGAALSWATGTVLVKRFAWSVPSTVLVGWQLLAGALPVVTGALVIERQAALGEVSSAAILATLYTIALPMIFCQWGYFQLVRSFPATLTAIGTLAIPVVGVFSSAMILGEALGARELVALGLVCSALAVVLVLPGFRPLRRG